MALIIFITASTHHIFKRASSQTCSLTAPTLLNRRMLSRNISMHILLGCWQLSAGALACVPPPHSPVKLPAIDYSQVLLQAFYGEVIAKYSSTP